MSKTTLTILLVAVILFATFTCAGIGAYIYTTMPLPVSNPGLAETQLAQMINAALTQTAQAQLPTMAPIVMPSSTPTSPFDPPPPTSTATLPPVIFTSTPSIPLISVSVNTNCRMGPGKVYDRVGYLLVGQASEIYGRNYAGDYWYIRNPNQNSQFCWLWGQYATVSGNIAALPVYTPPPTPTPMPNFKATYLGRDSCNSSWWMDIKLDNTGGVGFTSLTLTVRDTVADISQTLYSDEFIDKNGCSDSSIKDSLSPGVNRIVSSPGFTYDPVGHLMRATITLCSNEDQNGTCVTDVIEFTP